LQLTCVSAGYKLPKHIAKALQTRSKAIKTAIDKYNAAADAMAPQKPTLDWEQVVEYAFLADFDLLRESREDICQEAWALPSGRAAMDQHFKIVRAEEEIQRLNVEIRRLVTYIRDEDTFLCREEEQLREKGQPGLAHQVRLVRVEHARFTSLHMERLTKLSKVNGFSGNITPGISVSKEHHVPVPRGRDVAMRAPSPVQQTGDDAAPLPDSDGEGGEGSEGEEDDDDEGGLLAAFINIMHISGDDAAPAEDTQVTDL
jgi:hypothetical protein